MAKTAEDYKAKRKKYEGKTDKQYEKGKYLEAKQAYKNIKSSNKDKKSSK